MVLNRVPSGQPPATTILVRRARNGDEDSLAALVDRFTPLLLVQARYRLGSGRPHLEPEDIVQEVWVRSLPKLPELRERDGRHTPVFLKFLATTLLYRVQELLRERIRELREEGSGEGDPLPAETIGVVSRVVRGERQDRVWQLLDTLDPAERELLVLRGIEQQDNKVVAETLGETPNAISLRYNRLLTRLRRQFTGTILDEF